MTRPGGRQAAIERTARWPLHQKWPALQGGRGTVEARELGGRSPCWMSTSRPPGVADGRLVSCHVEGARGASALLALLLLGVGELAEAIGVGAGLAGGLLGLAGVIELGLRSTL